MQNIAIKVDARELEVDNLLLAVRWLTDPLRSKVLDIESEVLRVEVEYAACAFYKNPVIQSRIKNLLDKNAEIGGRLAASTLFDAIRHSVFTETYATIRNQIIVAAFTLDELLGKELRTKFDELTEDHVDGSVTDCIKIDANSISKFIDEYHRHKSDVGRYNRRMENVEEYVKKVLEKSVLPRLTSNVFATSELDATMHTVQTEMARKQDVNRIEEKIDTLIRAMKNVPK